MVLVRFPDTGDEMPKHLEFHESTALAIELLRQGLPQIVGARIRITSQQTIPGKIVREREKEKRSVAVKGYFTDEKHYPSLKYFRFVIPLEKQKEESTWAPAEEGGKLRIHGPAEPSRHFSLGWRLDKTKFESEMYFDETPGLKFPS
jgi:hypothetical protein